jgi:predicted 3-demethylubiquinone-9 3-methyltransferase (glyoxalase superfamily)
VRLDLHPGDLVVHCIQSVEELERLFRELSADGQVFVPLGTYPVSQNYVWFKDRYGVSWQLNLK